MNLFKSLVFTDKGIDDLTTAAEAGKTIEIKRGVLCGYNPPDDNQVYNPYRDASGVLDVDAVKSNINKYFAKSEALKATTTPTPYIEGIVKLKTVKKDNKNILSFALDFENFNFDHDVAVKFFGYESWAALIASEKELASDCKCLVLLAQDDAGLEYIFAFAKLASGQQLQYPLALTEELTHRLHVDLYISINQSDNIVIKYTPDGFVEYNEFVQHVANAEDVYAKKINVYTKVESDNSFLTKSDAAATYTTKTENAKKANSSDVYTKVESDGRFVRSATVNGGETITPNSEGNLALTVPDPDLSSLATKEDVNKKANASDVYTKSEVDSKTSGNVITAYDVASKNPTSVRDSYTNRSLVDQLALGQFADQINQLKGRRQVDAPDFNTLTETGVYMISNPNKGQNDPRVSGWGELIVFNGDNNGVTQIYAADNNIFVRTYWSGNTWVNWEQIAFKSDITDLQNNVYTKTASDGRFARSATINGGAKVTPNTEGNLALTVPDTTIQIFDTNAEARDYSAKHPNVLTGVLL